MNIFIRQNGIPVYLIKSCMMELILAIFSPKPSADRNVDIRWQCILWTPYFIGIKIFEKLLQRAGGSQDFLKK